MSGKWQDKSRKAGTLAERIGKLPQIASYLPRAQRKPELLLSPNIPKPLHGVAPRVVLGQSWWNKERKACYASTQDRCIACGVPKLLAEYHQWLEAHEVYAIDYELGRAVYVGSVPLCHFCHNSIHDGRLKALLDQGKVHHAKYRAIIQHRDKVLREAGVPPITPEERVKALIGKKIAPWSRWRMVVNGVEYPPKFTTYEAWLSYHGVPLTAIQDYVSAWVADEMDGGQ